MHKLQVILEFAHCNLEVQYLAQQGDDVCSHIFNYCILWCIMHIHIFGWNFQEKITICFIFN